MGHEIIIVNNRPSIRPLKSRTDCIAKLPIPTTKKDVRSFVGAVNYLSLFCSNLQLLLRPFYQLIKKDSKWAWTEDHTKRFTEIKEMLQKAPVLGMPNNTGTIRIYCDTSRLATGSSIYQRQGDKDVLLGYASKALNETMGRYSPTELELSGLWINVNIWKHLISGCNKVEIYTDHSALVHLIKAKSAPPTTRCKRLLEKLSDYNFSLGHVAGKKMVICDWLSRQKIEDDHPNEIIPISFSAVEDASNSREIDNVQVCESEEIEVLTKGESNSLSDPSHVSESGNNNSVSEEIVCPVSEPSRRITRGYAASNNITVTQGNLPQKWARKSKAVSPSNQGAVQQPALVEVPDLHNNDQPQIVQGPLTGMDTDIGHRANNRIRQEVRPRPTLVQTRQISETPPTLLQQIPTSQPQYIDDNTVTSPPSHLYDKPKPIMENLDNDSIMRKHIPRQRDIDKYLKIIKGKVLQDYNLPLSARTVKQEQRTSHNFKQIIDYIEHGRLPNRKRKMKAIIAQAENFIICDGLLFRLTLTADKEDCKLALCIPQSLATKIIELHHNTLFSNHAGITKTLVTIRKKYYIPNLLQLLISYHRSCQVCQQMKTPPNQHRDFVPRIPASYRPFETLHIDIKHFIEAYSGHKFLMVVVDPMTRYTIAIPMLERTAIEVAEKLLQHVVFIYGLPDVIVYDEDKAFENQVMKYLHNTLNIEQKFVSPENHGSLVSERFIKTMTNYIVSNITGNGKLWPLYAAPCAFSFNCFAMPHLGNLSPFELVFGRNPPDFCKLNYDPIDKVTVNYRDYVELLKNRLNHVSKTVLDLHTKLQQNQAQKQADRVDNSRNAWKVGMLVFLLSPNHSALVTNSKKIKMNWSGPYVISAMIDSNHVCLEDLTGRPIYGVFSVARLKVGWIQTKEGSVNNVQKLRQLASDKNKAGNEKGYSIVDENGQEIGNASLQNVAHVTYSKCVAGHALMNIDEGEV